MHPGRSPTRTSQQLHWAVWRSSRRNVGSNDWVQVVSWTPWRYVIDADVNDDVSAVYLGYDLSISILKPSVNPAHVAFCVYGCLVKNRHPVQGGTLPPGWIDGHKKYWVSWSVYGIKPGITWSQLFPWGATCIYEFIFYVTPAHCGSSGPCFSSLKVSITSQKKEHDNLWSYWIGTGENNIVWKRD